MALLPASFILKDNQLLSFQVGFSSCSHFRKAHTAENSKAKSWGKGILDLDFDARKCIIRNGERALLIQSFREFQTIRTREDDSDHFLTFTFDSDEWDIVPQNIAETACILHLAQHIGKDQIITATEVVRSGIQKRVLGLEQTPIFKQGLVQQHDASGRKLQARFLIVIPGKVFGFQRQQEMVGCPASFVTSLLNARVTTLNEVPGFQLHVDRSEPLYFDTLQTVERPSWIKELNAAIEFTKNALNGISITTRPSRTSKVQWKDTNQDAQQQLSSTTGLSNDQAGLTTASTSQKDNFLVASVGFDPNQEPPANAKVHDEESGNGETDSESHARSKPLSWARICLEDSLSELQILVGHVQAASYVLNDLHLFKSSKYPQKKNYPLPTMSRWPSTGKERSSPRTNWQHHYLSNGLHQDLMMWPESSLNSRHDGLYSTNNCLKELHETSVTGRQKDGHTTPYLQTFYQKQCAPAMGEVGQVQANNISFNSSTENLPLDKQDYKTGQKSSTKQAHNLNAMGDINDVLSIESDAELSIPSYSETPDNDEAASTQQPTATPTLQKSSMMIKPSLSRQASARASRAVAFMAHPDILNASDDIASSQIQVQPRTDVVTKRASDDFASRQSISIEKPYIASEPRASQTKFPFVDYQPSSGQDLLEDNPTSDTRQSLSSACKSTQQELGFTQSRQARMQLTNVTEQISDRNGGGFNFDSNTLALPNHQDFDGGVLTQNNDEYESMSGTVLNSSNQGSDSLVSKSPDKMETRKSTPNYNGSFVGGSQQVGKRQTYQAPNQDIVTFLPETGKSPTLGQHLDSSILPDTSFQSETKKNFANRQSQKAMSLPEVKKNTAFSRHSEDATFLPDSRKGVTLSRQSTGDALQLEVRKSMAVNKQNQNVISQPDVRKNAAANRQTVMQQPSNTLSNTTILSNIHTGELRKSIYQGGGNLQTEPNLQEQDQSSGDQEADLLDMASSVSSSSQSSTGPSALDKSAKPELVNGISLIDLPNVSDQGEIFASAAPKLENRKTRVASTNNGRAMDQAAVFSNQQRLPSRLSAYESPRIFMHSNTTTPRGKSQSYIAFDDNFRGADNKLSGRRRSQS